MPRLVTSNEGYDFAVAVCPHCLCEMMMDIGNVNSNYNQGQLVRKSILDGVLTSIDVRCPNTPCIKFVTLDRTMLNIHGNTVVGFKSLIVSAYKSVNV
jgi:hypothetical protein